MDKQLLALVLVISLVLLTSVQAFQINDLKSDIGESVPSGYPVDSSNYPTEGYSRQQNTPSMVGGC